MSYLSFSLLLALSLLAACTAPQLAPTPQPQVRPLVQQKIDLAREAHSKGQGRIALQRLSELQDSQLEPIERAVKYNLQGVIYFGESDWDRALLSFESAKRAVPVRTTLESQVWLNIASVYFKKGLFADLKSALEKIDMKLLPDNEVRKFAQLHLAWALKYQRHGEIVEYSVVLLKDAKSLSEVTDSLLKERMALAFKELSDKEKLRLLEKYEKEPWLPLAYLAQLEAEHRYFIGDTRGARDVVSWLTERFEKFPQIMSFTKDFEQRLDSSTRISMSGIGVVLPLTGEKGSFGQKALMGLDLALKESGLGREVEIHTRDSFDSPSVGAQAVRDLIQQHRVPLIVGGLFPDTAKAEYLEAKRWGVMYISLAPIYLAREEKNHLLIEVQGSIESQVRSLVSPSVINRFGKRIGVIYPQGDAGRAYADEFWRAALANELQVSAMATYSKGTLDFRETLKHFLGLRFPRERQEELDLYRDVYSQERTSIRRIQNLPPSIDFDWVFVASYPQEAVSLIPTFGYYDARNLKIFGGPSWASRNLVKEQKNLGRLYLVGEDPADADKTLFKVFQETYAKPPTLIETLGFDAAVLASQLIKDSSVTQRSVFDARMKELGVLRGSSSDWKLADGLWLKGMRFLTIRDGELRRVFDEELR